MKQAQSRFDDGLPFAEDAQQAEMAASVQARLPLPVPETTNHLEPARRCAGIEGFSLHANTRVHENDRLGLETLCAYGARGPVALERLSFREDGRLEYRLKKPAPDGSTLLVLTPIQLVKRLAALIVKPRIHLTRFFGIFASNSKFRRRVAEHAMGPKTSKPIRAPQSVERNPGVLPPRPKLDWSALLRRTMGVDLFQCPGGGRRTVIAVIEQPSMAKKILRHLGLLQGAVPPWKATGPPQLALAL